MANCLYCQTPIILSSAQPEQSSFILSATVTAEQFCCKSCELIWNWTHQKKITLPSSDQLKTADYDYLSSIEIEKKYQREPNQRKFKFHIEGLDCISCVHLLEELPAILPGVKVAKLDMSESTLYVELDSTVKLPVFCSQLAEMGYAPTLLQSDDQLQSIQKLENRKDLKKLAIAGAVAGNIMLFTVPLYGGLNGQLGLTFKWISFVLFLPLLFYSSQSFYKNALQSLQKRMINVDVTIVIALWLGFVLSTLNLINNKDELYFDSTASFIFLILCSRFYMKKIQQKFLIKNILSHLFQKEIYLNLSNNKKVTAEQIQAGDIIQVQQGQILPCDADLESLSAEFDLSYLTGESWPEKFERNHPVFAGARLLSLSGVIKAKGKPKESHLGQLVKRIDEIASSSEVYKTETDKAAHWLTIIVLSIAFLFFLFFYQTNSWMAFQRSLALLIVACPCAIAFGTPLALSLGTKKAYQKGYFIRSESFFERLVSVKKVILDKTGTLTESNLQLMKTFPPQISDELKSFVLMAESESRHPVAVSLKKEWGNQIGFQGKNFVEVINIKNIPGLGVEAQVKTNEGLKVISVQRAPHMNQASGYIEVVISVDSVAKAYLYFEEKIREKTYDFVQKLYDLKYEVFILTGDLKNRALDFSNKFKIPAFRVFSEQTPEMKEQVIQQHNPCLYIGDGLNDLLALKSAHVSYAIEGQFDVTLSVADVYAPKKGPEGILELIRLSQQIQSIVRGNLFFALIYNLIAGGMALTGAMSPLLAAILMPISSSVILTHTIWRLK